MISRTNRIGNWGNRSGKEPWRKRKSNAAGELWCKNCKEYHPVEEFSPQHGFCAQACKKSRNDALRQSRIRNIECKQCKRPFISRNKIQSYCSPRCKSKAIDIKNSTATAICPNCQTEFQRPPRMRQKYCSKPCAFIGRRRSPDKALARGKRGPDWPKQSSLARLRDGNICVICDQKDGKNITVDHIVPYRLAKEWSSDPNNLTNLACMCGSCHGTKTGVESALLRGDVLGFIMNMTCRVGLSEDRLYAALSFFHLPFYRRTI